MGEEFFHVDRRTDLKNLTVVFPNLAKELLIVVPNIRNKTGDDR
jgi:hypothetical protein